MKSIRDELAEALESCVSRCGYGDDDRVASALRRHASMPEALSMEPPMPSKLMAWGKTLMENAIMAIEAEGFDASDERTWVTEVSTWLLGLRGNTALARHAAEPDDRPRLLALLKVARTWSQATGIDGPSEVAALDSAVAACSVIETP